MNRKIYSSLFIFCIAFVANVNAGTVSSSDNSIDPQALQKVRHLLSMPEEKIDFAHAKLIIDQIIDPRVNVPKTKNRLQEMVQTIEELNLQTDMEKKEALRQYLYESGSWNDYKPFQYNFCLLYTSPSPRDRG